MSTFPFDKQKCVIIYGNLVSTMDQVAFNKHQNNFSKAPAIYTPSEEFALRDLDVTYNEYDEGAGDKVCTLHFNMLLIRRPYYYIVNIIVPCGLLCCLSLLSFILPPASGERISLQVTVMLSLVVFQLMITGLVPVTSNNTPLMSKLDIEFACLSCVTSMQFIYLPHMCMYPDFRLGFS